MKPTLMEIIAAIFAFVWLAVFVVACLAY